jgi:hypothetical protein
MTTLLLVLKEGRGIVRKKQGFTRTGNYVSENVSYKTIRKAIANPVFT